MSSSTQAAAQDNNEELAKMRAAYNQMAKEIQVLASDREWLEETYAQETEKVEVKSERLRLALLDLKRDAYDMFAQYTEERANIDSETLLLRAQMDKVVAKALKLGPLARFWALEVAAEDTKARGAQSLTASSNATSTTASQ